MDRATGRAITDHKHALKDHNDPPLKTTFVQLECNRKIRWIRHKHRLTSQNQIRLSPVRNNRIYEDFIHIEEWGVKVTLGT